jgi:predicted  nucleic acid-binding Zn-ribbon protein
MEIENTLKKMGIVLEKLAEKIDELDKRVAKIEEKLGDGEKKFSSQDFKANPQMQQPQTQKASSNSSLGGFGSSFLGSLTGAMAGMGLYHLLFDHSVTPESLGQSLGMNESEIDNVELDNIDEKLDEIDSKLDEIDEKLDKNMASDDVMDNDYYESYEEDTGDTDFGSGFDDFEGIDDFDEV